VCESGETIMFCFMPIIIVAEDKTSNGNNATLRVMREGYCFPLQEDDLLHPFPDLVSSEGHAPNLMDMF
jgi:hypothetical protein